MLGIRFSWVAVTKKGGWVDSDNPCVGWKRGDGSRAALARDWAVSSYAGAAAEERLGEGVAPWYRDFDNAETWLGSFAPPRGAAYVGDDVYEKQAMTLRRRAQRLVDRHWVAIDRIARALLRLDALQEHEVAAVVRGEALPAR